MSISKRAVEFLTADIRSILVELEGLDQSIREFEAKREAARIKLEVLKKAIGPDFQTELDLPKPHVITPGTANITLELSRAAVTEANNSDSTEKVGFRASIRGVLSETSRGMKPRDVCVELQKRGVPFTGKLLPENRTYNEMWRMMKLGQLRRRAGLYSIPTTVNTGG